MMMTMMLVMTPTLKTNWGAASVREGCHPHRGCHLQPTIHKPSDGGRKSKSYMDFQAKYILLGILEKLIPESVRFAEDNESTFLQEVHNLQLSPCFALSLQFELPCPESESEERCGC